MHACSLLTRHTYCAQRSQERLLLLSVAVPFDLASLHRLLFHASEVICATRNAIFMLFCRKEYLDKQTCLRTGGKFFKFDHTFASAKRVKQNGERVVGCFATGMNEYGQPVLQFGAVSTSLDEARPHIEAYRERKQQLQQEVWAKSRYNQSHCLRTRTPLIKLGTLLLTSLINVAECFRWATFCP